MQQAIAQPERTTLHLLCGGRDTLVILRISWTFVIRAAVTTSSGRLAHAFRGEPFSGAGARWFSFRWGGSAIDSTMSTG